MGIWKALTGGRWARDEGHEARARFERHERLANEILEVDRMMREPEHHSPEAIRARRYEVALESKRAIEDGIARHGLLGLGLSLKDIREAEQEFKAAGLEDWRLRVRF